MLEFLLANHPLDCPVCDRGGECELQEMTFDWGDLEERFTERKTTTPRNIFRRWSPTIRSAASCANAARASATSGWAKTPSKPATAARTPSSAPTAAGLIVRNAATASRFARPERCSTGSIVIRPGPGSWHRRLRPARLLLRRVQCQLGSRGDELLRIVARDRYVNGHNGEFLCVKGRFGHPLDESSKTG